MIIFEMCYVDDIAGSMAENVSLFAEARKRLARGKAMEVIDLEPLALIEQMSKEILAPLKRKMEASTPLAGKLMADTMRSTRTSRRLAGLKTQSKGGSSSGTIRKVTSSPIVIEKEGLAGEIYMPYWNLSKTSRLTTLDEKRWWVDNMMLSGARIKFEIFKDTELGGHINHAIYELILLIF